MITFIRYTVFIYRLLVVIADVLWSWLSFIFQWYCWFLIQRVLFSYPFLKAWDTTVTREHGALIRIIWLAFLIRQTVTTFLKYTFNNYIYNIQSTWHIQHAHVIFMVVSPPHNHACWYRLKELHQFYWHWMTPFPNQRFIQALNGMSQPMQEKVHLWHAWDADVNEISYDVCSSVCILAVDDE